MQGRPHRFQLERRIAFVADLGELLLCTSKFLILESLQESWLELVTSGLMSLFSIELAVLH